MCYANSHQIRAKHPAVAILGAEPTSGGGKGRGERICGRRQQGERGAARVAQAEATQTMSQWLSLMVFYCVDIIRFQSEATAH